MKKNLRKKSRVFITGGENGGAALVGAITAFANLFNDEFQQTKKLNEILETEGEEKKQRLIREAMTEKYEAMVQVVADLDEPTLKQFTASYMPAPFAMLQMNDYAIMEGIMQHMAAFEAAREKDRLWLEQKLNNAVFEDKKKMEKPPVPER